MKTNPLKHLLTLTLIMGISFSCENYKEGNDLDEKLNIEEYNQNLIKSFIGEFEQIIIVKSSSDNISKFDTKASKNLFIKYFNDLKIEVDGEIYSLIEYEGITSYELYESTLDKLYEMKYYVNNDLKSSPSLEEIRDAMMKECDTYVALLEKPCKAAVLIAYAIKKL